MQMKDSNGIPILKSTNSEMSRQFKQPAELKIAKLNVRDLYRRQNGKCFYCLIELYPYPHSTKLPNGWTRDHCFLNRMIIY